MNKKLPRGVRNNNPANIEYGAPWQGLVPVSKRKDPRFAEFLTPAWGIRAMARTLITYQDTHNIRTVAGIVNRWAPPPKDIPEDNNPTEKYAAFVANAADVGVDSTIDIHDYRYARPIVEAMIRFENFKGPLNTLNTWYERPVIDEGLRMAGIRKPVKEAAKVPVTKETIGATTTGVVGVAEVAENLPSVVEAINSADDHLSSGSAIRVVIGIVLIAAAIFIAYSQVERHKSGEL